MPKHLVTGGAGFIGSHIADALVRRGDEVVILDDFSTGRRENLAEFRQAVRVVEADLACASDLDRHLRGVDAVFHHAAIPSVARSMEDPTATHRANVEGTLNLLLACRRSGVRRVVYASSSAVYGDCPMLPIRESAPARPLSPYGAQKYCAEIYMQVFWRAYGLETVSLRYFNVFGPRQDAASPYGGVIARFVPAVLRGERPVIHGDGRQSRDFVYVADVVEANLRAAEAEGVAGEVFNIARGVRVTVGETLDEIRRLTGQPRAPIHDAPRSGDIRHSQADPSKARERLGWRPGTGFSAGLEKTIAWSRQDLTAHGQLLDA